MGYQLWIPDVLRDWGLPVDVVSGWERRGSAFFEPVGTMCHHTGAGGVTVLRRILTYGRSDLPGPLCQVDLTPDGRVGVIAAGRANHAGRGSWRGASGNSRWLGIEAHSPGNGYWTPIQRDRYPILVAALNSGLRAPADMAPAHREYAKPAGRKPDPAGIDMPDLRADVARLLTRPATAPAAAITTTVPEDEMLQLCQVIGDARVWAVSLARGVVDHVRTAEEIETADRLGQLVRGPDGRPQVIAINARQLDVARAHAARIRTAA